MSKSSLVEVYTPTHLRINPKNMPCAIQKQYIWGARRGNWFIGYRYDPLDMTPRTRLLDLLDLVPVGDFKCPLAHRVILEIHFDRDPTVLYRWVPGVPNQTIAHWRLA